MNNRPVTFDLARARADFDGDDNSVAEVLLVFLEDLDASVTALEDSPARGRAAVAAVLHEVANTLESSWCFDGGRRVRELEKLCHGDEPLDMHSLQQEARELMAAAAEQVRLWLRKRYP